MNTLKVQTRRKNRERDFLKKRESEMIYIENTRVIIYARGYNLLKIRTHTYIKYIYIILFVKY